ncbi:DUF3047 domain-containing protein [Rhodococcus sp. G-MC3]|uniref:DUF3047 domain-containing protein n=1 Tax=Rhodococcus sp. G-MC3 TaxID=3046209 RepID=UPI0024B9BD87|nr:DUF3047 domain-containing protein [Rhodococcus sp. G-MC3]MDJ0392642.1 DUF3047 domain-containing protein [Rhodococcus sp. G-MC3]
MIRSRIGARPDVPLINAAALARRVDRVLAESGASATVASVAVTQKAGWVSSGVVVHRGDHITVLATGMLWAVRGLGLGIGPDVAVWVRVGEGAVISMLGTGMVIVADTDGPVSFLAAEPGSLDENGALDTAVRRMRLRGSFAVAVARWDTDPDAGLVHAARIDPALFGPIAARSSRPALAGWHYHPRLGAAEIFRTRASDTSDEIDCVTSGDVGILCHPVDVEITPELRMSWSWLVTALPSMLPENIEPTHDYLSVAVEFDDGRDLTWMWSSELNIGTVFTCPLQYWRDRETHMVIRTGTIELGEWLDERRSIVDDIRAALEPPYPQRITGIWLIANSSFQRGTGACRYRDLDLAESALGEIADPIVLDKEHHR